MPENTRTFENDSFDNEKTPGGSETGHVPIELGETFDPLEEPKVEMYFKTTKEAFDYYNAYARRKGFSVRIRRTNKNRADGIQRQVLVC